jgi:hypothetical protein
LYLQQEARGMTAKFKVGDKITFGNKYPGVITKVHRLMGGYTIVMSEGRYKNKDYRASEQSLSMRK